MLDNTGNEHTPSSVLQHYLCEKLKPQSAAIMAVPVVTKGGTLTLL